MAVYENPHCQTCTRPSLMLAKARNGLGDPAGAEASSREALRLAELH